MKHVANLGGAAIIGVLIYLGAKFGELAVLHEEASGFPELIEKGAWLALWDHWAILCMVAGSVTYLIWYVIGQTMKSDFSAQSTKRPIWILLLVIPAIVSVWGVLTLPPITRGAWLAQLFLFVDALLTFWLMSVFFSPSRVKYDPFLSQPFRKIRDAMGI